MSLGKGEGGDVKMTYKVGRAVKKVMPLTQILLCTFFYNSIFPSWFHMNQQLATSFYSFFVKISEQHRGSDRLKLTEYDKVEWGKKRHYASLTYFLNGPMFNLLFYCHVFLY